MVVTCARPPLLPPLLLLECALEPPTTRAKIHSRANLAHSVTAIGSSTTVRHRRQHCRGVPILVSEDARVLLLACPVTPHRLPLSRAHGSYAVYGRFSRRSTGGGNWRFKRGFLQPGYLLFRFVFRRRERALPATLLNGHGLSSATGSALSAPFPSAAA